MSTPMAAGLHEPIFVGRRAQRGPFEDLLTALARGERRHVALLGLRRIGKTTLNHMDGMLRSLLGPIARCPVHVVEALNLAPDGNVSVAEARASWPGKAISINSPSSIYLAAPDVIRQTTLDLLRQAAPGRGFVVGITENVPADVIEASLRVIAETLNECGRCPVDPAALPPAAQG